MNQLLNYYCQGEGKPLLIIHGLFGASRNWKTLAKQFARHFSVTTLDLRNHGDSFHADSMTYHDMVQDVHELMNALEIEHASVIGHSMGGKVAMKLTEQYPQRIDRLVVADVAPVAYRHHYDDIIDPVLALDLAALRNRRDADEQLKAAIGDQRIRLFILQNLEFKEGSARWKLNWQAIHDSIHDSIDDITGFEDISGWTIATPSLFIRGENSDYITASGLTLIRQHFCDVQFVTLPGAGHWLHAEQPEAFYQSVNTFLAEK